MRSISLTGTRCSRDVVRLEDDFCAAYFGNGAAHGRRAADPFDRILGQGGGRDKPDRNQGQCRRQNCCAAKLDFHASNLNASVERRQAADFRFNV